MNVNLYTLEWLDQTQVLNIVTWQIFYYHYFYLFEEATEIVKMCLSTELATTLSIFISGHGWLNESASWIT